MENKLDTEIIILCNSEKKEKLRRYFKNRGINMSVGIRQMLYMLIDTDKER